MLLAIGNFLVLWFGGNAVITGAITGKTVTPTAVQSPPHWKTWTTRRLASPATASGLIASSTNLMPPSGSNIGCLFSGRVFINIMENPNQWLASTQYYNGTMFDLWIPDEVDSLEPIT